MKYQEKNVWCRASRGAALCKRKWNPKTDPLKVGKLELITTGETL
jgi:hypothetical protein